MPQDIPFDRVGIPIQTNFRPVDTFAPALVQRADTSKASQLAEVAQALGQWAGTTDKMSAHLFEARNRGLVESAQLTAAHLQQAGVDTSKKLKQAVQKGQINLTDNPIFMKALEQDMGRYEVRSQMPQLMQQYETTGVKNATDGGTVRQFVNQFYAPAFGEMSDNAKLAASEEIGRISDGLIARHTELLQQRAVEQAKLGLSNEFTETINNMVGNDTMAALHREHDAVSQGLKGPQLDAATQDATTARSQLKAVKDRLNGIAQKYRDSGMSSAEVDTAVLATVTKIAEAHEDATLGRELLNGLKWGNSYSQEIKDLAVKEMEDKVNEARVNRVGMQVRLIKQQQDLAALQWGSTIDPVKLRDDAAYRASTLDYLRTKLPIEYRPAAFESLNNMLRQTDAFNSQSAQADWAKAQQTIATRPYTYWEDPRHSDELFQITSSAVMSGHLDDLQRMNIAPWQQQRTLQDNKAMLMVQDMLHNPQFDMHKVVESLKDIGFENANNIFRLHDDLARDGSKRSMLDPSLYLPDLRVAMAIQQATTPDQIDKVELGNLASTAELELLKTAVRNSDKSPEDIQAAMQHTLETISGVPQAKIEQYKKEHHQEMLRMGSATSAVETTTPSLDKGNSMKLQNHDIVVPKAFIGLVGDPREHRQTLDTAVKQGRVYKEVTASDNSGLIQDWSPKTQDMLKTLIKSSTASRKAGQIYGPQALDGWDQFMAEGDQLLREVTNPVNLARRAKAEAALRKPLTVGEQLSGAYDIKGPEAAWLMDFQKKQEYAMLLLDRVGAPESAFDLLGKESWRAFPYFKSVDDLDREGDAFMKRHGVPADDRTTFYYTQGALIYRRNGRTPTQIQDYKFNSLKEDKPQSKDTGANQ